MKNALRWVPSALALSLLLGSSLPEPLQGQQRLPQTYQEANDYRAGATPFEPLMSFWYDAAELYPEYLSIRPLTRTLLGREITLVTLSSQGGSITPQDALRSGKPIVFIANSVHGGETAGKEAAQLVAKDLLEGDLRSILDDVVVLIMPLVNPDGGEVLRRTNEQGFDMNRDYVKLESQEIRAIVTQVMNEWTPDIHIDSHHGGAAPYTITWQGTLNPAADEALRRFPYERIFPQVRAALRAEDYDGFDYSGPQTRDGVRGWGSTSLEARKHHVYTGLVNSIGILTETPSSTHRVLSDGTVQPIPEEDRYRHQVRGQWIFMRETLKFAQANGSDVRAVTNGARERAIAGGVAGGDPVVVEYEIVSRGDEPVWLPDETAAGGFTLTEAPIWLEGRTVRTVPRPLGYILPIAMAPVLPRLFDHGIAVYRFSEETTLPLEVYEAVKVKRGEFFQGTELRSVEVEKTTREVTVEEGAYWIPTAQTKANLISYIFEPETDDNLITWGWTDHLLQITPNTLEEAEAALLAPFQGVVTDAQRARVRERAQQQLEQRQQVPMMRLVEHHELPVVRLTPLDRDDRNRYYEIFR